MRWPKIATAACGSAPPAACRHLHRSRKRACRIAAAGSVLSQVTFGTRAIADEARGSVECQPAGDLDGASAQLSRMRRHVRIRYRLIGEQESDWVETREMQRALPSPRAGNYRFEGRSRGCEPGGAVSPVAEILFRRSLRCWWQSGPLRAGLILAGWRWCWLLAWRWRVDLLMQQKRHLEQAVQRRTEDLEREKTELVRTREQMRHFAEHDDLTGLWNHRIIVERLRGEVDRSRRDGAAQYHPG